MWKLIFEFLEKHFQKTPRERLAKSLLRLFAAMTQCHKDYCAFKPKADALFDEWKVDNTLDRYQAYEKYWTALYATARPWINSIVETAKELDDLRITLDVSDPDLLSTIRAYMNGESEAAYAAKDRFGLGKVYDFAGAIGRSLDKLNVYDPDTCQSIQREDNADFEIAIDKLRQFMIDKVKLSPEEVHAASRRRLIDL